MITLEQIERIGNLVASWTLSETLVIELRRIFPRVHFTYCMDDDVVAASPVYEDAGFNLYLVGGGSHCLAFTRDPELATGVVIAGIEEL